MAPLPPLLRTAAAAALSLAAAGAAAQVPADDSIVARVRRDGTRHDAPRAVLWVDRDALPPEEARAFAALVSDGVAAVERITARALDRARYGEERIHVFVSRAVTVSHVYGSYDHQRHARPYLFLSAAKVRRREAPYLHEATHLVAWRFGSHSLREGVASHVESLAAAEGAGYAAGLFGVRDAASADSLARLAVSGAAAERVLPWVGGPGFAPASVTSPSDLEARAAYYVLSQSLAQFLARELGLATVLRLYEAEDTERAYVALTGRDRAAWTRRWIAGLRGEVAAR